MHTLSDLNFDQVYINSKFFLALTFTEWNESLTLKFQDLLMESIRDKSGNCPDKYKVAIMADQKSPVLR